MSNNEITVSVKDIPEVKEQLEKADKELERLNNIINELEKWLKEQSKDRLERTPYDEVNIKLQELKGE